MPSPFKFLDAYTKEDKDIFFGRDNEIEELYQKVFGNKLLLVCGVSGTGKTSLINCGLANKFEESDWLPINIRRGNDITSSLKAGISKVALTPVKENQSIIKQLQSLYLDHFKPVYLIFDQFEEVFIFGNREERQELIKEVKKIVDSDVQCRLLFVMREEYLAGAIEFEREIPTFLTNRIRIEKMTWHNARQVIEEPCKVHGIEVEEGLAENILGKLCPESTEVELTYLQVLLDKMYRLLPGTEPISSNSLLTTHDSLAHSSDSRLTTHDSRVMTLAMLQQVGDVSDLLGSFLEEQISQLEEPETGLVILKSFVSVKGTKRQVTNEDITDFAYTLGKQISGDELKNLIQKFINLRILRDKDESGRYELRHDSLSTKIYEKITLYEKELLEVRQFLDNAYANYDKRKKLLGVDDLEYIAPYEKKLFLNPSLIRFIETSKREVHMAKRRRRQIITFLASALIIILSGFTIWALNERGKAVKLRSVAVEQKDAAIKATEEAEKAKREAVEERNNAIEQEKHAEEQRNLALLAKQEAIKSQQEAVKSQQQAIIEKNKASDNYRIAMANNFSLKAEKIAEYNPTIALRLAEHAWDLDKNENIKQVLIKIYRENFFYKIIVRFEDDLSSILSISPDRKTILVGSKKDNTARLVDLKGNELKIFKGHTQFISSGAFSPDGKKILTASRDYTLRLWDLSGRLLHDYSLDYITNRGSYPFFEFMNDPELIKFSPDGQSILTGYADKKARLLDMDGYVLKVFEGHDDNISSVAFSPDGINVLTSSLDGTTKLWDINGNLLQDFERHLHTVSSVDFSPDGKYIVTGSWDKTARLWDQSGNLLHTLEGHEFWVNAVAFSPDGKYIVTGSTDKTARLWDLSGNLIQVCKGHDGEINFVAFSPDGKSIYTGSGMRYGDQTIRQWNISGYQSQEIEGQGVIFSQAFTPDGQRILIASGDSTVRLLDLNGNYLLQLFKDYDGFINYLDTSPDGKLILTGTYDKTARLWDINGNLLQVFGWSIMSVAFSPDGKNILTGSSGSTARLWDLSGNIVQEYEGPINGANPAVFSPDGKYVLTGSSGKTAWLWDLSGNIIQSFEVNQGSPLSFAFAPDGKKIIIGYGNSTAHLWDLSGNILHTFTQHNGEIGSVAFSPDGQYILTGTWMDSSAKMWDLSGNLIQVFTGHQDALNSVTFSPDGKKVLTRCWDGTARIWDVEIPFEEFLKNNDFEELTEAQKIEFGILNND